MAQPEPARYDDHTPHPSSVKETDTPVATTAHAINSALMFDPKLLNDENAKAEVGDCIAIDCECVGVGKDGKVTALARVSVVNIHGHCILDVYVKPKWEVTDWRTRYSGVLPEHMVNGGSLLLCVLWRVLTMGVRSHHFRGGAGTGQ